MPSASPDEKPASRVALVLVVSAMVLYLGFLLRHTCYAAGGSDSSGYLNAAHLVAGGNLRVRIEPLDTMHLSNDWQPVFQPLGLVAATDRRYLVPSYPLGYPAQLALLGTLGGWRYAPFLVTPFAALGTLWLMYLLAVEFGLTGYMAAAPSVLLAISAPWLFQAFQPMSDVPATFWCGLAMLMALRAERRPVHALLCGAAFGIAVWTRPSDLLLALPIAIALRWRVRPLMTAVLGALPFGVTLMAVNHYLYGNALTTGYGSLILSQAPCAPVHAKWLLITLTPLILPACLLSLLDKRIPPFRRWVLGTWVGVFYIFYSLYPICDAWWYLRFLLPAFPPLFLGAVVVLDRARWPPALKAACVAVVAGALIMLSRHYDARGLRPQEQEYRSASLWAQGQLPPKSIVATMQMSGAYFYYTGKLPARYDILDPQRFEELRAYAGVAELPWYALVFDWEVPELERRMPAHWRTIGDYKDVRLLRLD